MNIFVLDRDLELSAQYHCNKHVVKMPVEYAQMLCSAMHGAYTDDVPYRRSYYNHPCGRWVRHSIDHYQYLWTLAYNLGLEYTYRYGKIHASHKLLLDGKIPYNIDLPENGFVSYPPNCTTHKNPPYEFDIIDIYRLYYVTDKSHILQYHKRPKPYWLSDYDDYVL